MTKDGSGLTRRLLMRAGVLSAAVAMAGAACSNSSTPASSHVSKPKPTVTVATLPTATTIAQPVVYGYYDGHVDSMLSTDVTNQSQATAQRINYSAALAAGPASAYPALYMVTGTAAPHQPVVFSTEPGEVDYNPLWNETTVQWKTGVAPVLLVKDDQIKALASKGKLTITPTGIILNCPIVHVGKTHALPMAATVSQPVVYGYYDGHVDSMLSTDVNSKTQAKAQHINFSASMAAQLPSAFPALYVVKGTMAPHQPVVFSTQPGEADYTPLWDVTTVRWKPGVTPVLLVKDDQVKALGAQGKLTIVPSNIVLNCPIVKVG